jgi:hypothetical protein
MAVRKGNTIRIPKGFYTTKTLAAMIGRDPDTVGRWRKAGVLPVAKTMTAGMLRIPLFDNAGLEVAKVLADQSRRNLTDRVMGSVAA